MMEAEANSIYGLARDIATRGVLNPSDPIIVIPSGSRYIVVEGNRRLSALRLLKKPNLAHNPSDQKRFASLAKRFPLALASVSAVVAPDREEANIWIDLKHTGPGKGEGTKVWGPQAKRTFNARSGGTKTFVEALVDAINGWYKDDSEMIGHLYQVIHGNQLTNLERIIDTPEGRKFSGLKQSGNSIESQFPPEKLKPFLSFLLKSLATPLPEKSTPWSRVWGNFDQRKSWLNERAEMMPPESDRSTTYDHKAPPPSALPEVAEPAANIRTQKPLVKPQPGPSNPFDRSTLNFDGFVVHGDYPATIHVLVSEVKDLKIADFPNTTFDILRTLVEKTIKAYAYLQATPIVPKRGSFVQFSDCLDWIESHTDNNPELKQHYRAIRNIKTSTNNFLITADAYNAANHDHNVTYGENAVREAWTSVHGIMKFLLRTGPEKP